MYGMKTKHVLSCMVVLAVVLASGCIQKNKTVPHEARWGIYSLDLATESVELVYSSPTQISGLHLNRQGNMFAIHQRVGGDTNKYEEIFTLGVDGRNLKRLTNNSIWDIYPVWSPDGSKIAYLSWPESSASLDIYTMNSDGSGVEELYDSDTHDSDINWQGDKITFTRDSQIWIMNDDGTGAVQVTNPSNAGVWGTANLPFGDYDPRLSPDGTKIVFERLVNDTSPHGNYDLFLINPDGSGETRLTNSGYSQGLAVWSNAGDKITYLVAAIGTLGKYDIYIMDSDGMNNRDISPEYFPANFLCNSPIFSENDSKIYFVGEWWE